MRIPVFSGLSKELADYRREVESQIKGILDALRIVARFIADARKGAAVLAQPFLVFEEESSGSVALRRSGTGLLVRLGDDSDYTRVYLGSIYVQGTGPHVFMQEYDAATDGRVWRVLVDGGILKFSLVNDALNVLTEFLRVTRSATTVLNVKAQRFCQTLPTATDDTNLAPSNGDCYAYLQSDTSLRFRARGSDGTVREGSLTIA